MQQKITKQEIKKKLEFLHSKLPKQPTAIRGMYLLPGSFLDNVQKTNFSQASLQQISDHIGYFLGLVNSVKVKVGIESFEHMLVAPSDISRADQVGLYKVISGYEREIQLTKKFRFSIEHILAILTHESVHHYLFYHGVQEPDESQNEILTDLATAYLGLGHLLIKGYEPITWTSDHWSTFNASGYTTHRVLIGYVRSESICYAIAKAAELRYWQPREVVHSIPSKYRQMIRFYLWSYNRKWRRGIKEAKRKERFRQQQLKQIKELTAQANEIQSKYNQIREKMQQISNKPDQISIPPEKGRLLVDIANKISTGEIQFTISKLSQELKASMDYSIVKNDDLLRLSTQARDLLKITKDWCELLNKYY